jgi:hypothetical protein
MPMGLRILILLALMTVRSLAEDAPTDEQIPDFDPFAVKKLEKPFEYYPLDAELWGEMQEKLEEKEFKDVIYLGEDNQAGSEDDPARAAEGKLIWGIGLAEAGFPYAAMFVFKEIAVEQSGSGIASEALHRLDFLVREHPYDFEMLTEFLTSKQFANLHPEIQSFVSYHRVHHHLKLELYEWFKEEFANIKDHTYWHFRWQYFLALKLISRNQIEPAKEKLKLVLDTDAVDETLKEKARIQVARLHFENGDFQKAYEIYERLDELPVREKGRILLEKSWAKYYLKDFSKALGLLHVLKAPFFDPSLNYERYLLEILIYRQLCHYEAVEIIVEDFRQRFSGPLRTIRERGDLRRDPILSTIALMDPYFQEYANMIDGLRKERYRMEDAGFTDNLYARILRFYTEKEKAIRERIERDLEDKVREVALELIDAEEQITFLDYTAKLDALRIVRQGENRSYAAPKISRWSFEKIYWQVGREFWWDELDFYQSMISSRCDLLYTPSGGSSNPYDVELDL